MFFSYFPFWGTFWSRSRCFQQCCRILFVFFSLQIIHSIVLSHISPQPKLNIMFWEHHGRKNCPLLCFAYHYQQQELSRSIIKCVPSQFGHKKLQKKGEYFSNQKYCCWLLHWLAAVIVGCCIGPLWLRLANCRPPISLPCAASSFSFSFFILFFHSSTFWPIGWHTQNN